MVGTMIKRPKRYGNVFVSINRETKNVDIVIEEDGISLTFKECQKIFPDILRKISKSHRG